MSVGEKHDTHEMCVHIMSVYVDHLPFYLCVLQVGLQRALQRVLLPGFQGAVQPLLWSV